MTTKASKRAAKGALRTVRSTSRRQEYSASTRRALVDVATELFTEQGYAGTSLDEIVAGARVTKGALYHHFSGKQALFESVFEKVEERAARDIHKAVRGNRDPWEKALGGLRAFLEVLQAPRYRRIVIADGPAVLGYERYREQEERTTFGIVQEIVSSVLSSYDLEPSMVETFSRVFFGAMSAAGAAVSTAEDPRKAGAEVEAAIGYILAGLRQMAESGAPLPGPDDLVSSPTTEAVDGRAEDQDDDPDEDDEGSDPDVDEEPDAR
jgi:AcrR family transcriptional regulator